MRKALTKRTISTVLARPLPFLPSSFFETMPELSLLPYIQFILEAKLGEEDARLPGRIGSKNGTRKSFNAFDFGRVRRLDRCRPSSFSRASTICSPRSILMELSGPFGTNERRYTHFFYLGEIFPTHQREGSKHLPPARGFILVLPLNSHSLSLDLSSSSRSPRTLSRLPSLFRILL